MSHSATSNSEKRKILLIAGYLRSCETQYNLACIPTDIHDIIYVYQKYCDVWNTTYLNQSFEIDGHTPNAVNVRDDSRCSVFGEHVVYAGVFKWKLRIAKICYNGIEYPPFVGIIKNKDDILSQRHRDTSWYTGHEGYMFCGGVRKLYCSTFNEREYGTRFHKAGHVIEIILDLDKRTLSYVVNGQDHGIAFEGIDKAEYRFALGVCDNHGSVFEFV